MTIGYIHEDFDEHQAYFIDELRSRKPSLSSKQVTVVFLDCPYCSRTFGDIRYLEIHIAEAHTNQYVYVRVNGHVVNDYIFVDEEIKTLEIIHLGSGKISVDVISKQNNYQEKFTVDEKLELADSLKTVTKGEIHLIVRGPVKHTFILFLKELPDFSNRVIDKDAYDLLFYPLNKESSINYSQFSKHHIVNTKNPLEKRYSEGLHDYALAFDLEIKNKPEAKTHFENSFFLLCPFRTSFSITARRVLAFRMNYFDHFENCSPNSRFYGIKIFFNHPNATILSKFISSDATVAEHGVYFDEFTYMYIDAIQAFFGNEDDILDSYLSRLENIATTSQQNNYDKLLYMRGRQSQKMNQMDKAKEYFDQLRYHPDFELAVRRCMR
jgi:hypothetical protein